MLPIRWVCDDGYQRHLDTVVRLEGAPGEAILVRSERHFNGSGGTEWLARYDLVVDLVGIDPDRAPGILGPLRAAVQADRRAHPVRWPNLWILGLPCVVVDEIAIRLHDRCRPEQSPVSGRMRIGGLRYLGNDCRPPARLVKLIAPAYAREFVILMEALAGVTWTPAGIDRDCPEIPPPGEGA
jgi:hypothetical protein